MTARLHVHDRPHGAEFDNDPAEDCPRCGGSDAGCEFCGFTGQIDLQEMARRRRERLAELSESES